MSANVVYSFSGYCRYDHIYNVLFNFHKVEDTKPYRSAKCSLHELEDFLKELQFDTQMAVLHLVQTITQLGASRLHLLREGLIKLWFVHPGPVLLVLL